MRRAFIGILLLSTAATAATVTPKPGTASGKLVVGGKPTALTHAFVIEKNTLLQIILADQTIDSEALAKPDGLTDFAAGKDLAAVAIQLDEQRRAEEVFFFHPKLPPGLSVREVSTFTAKDSSVGMLSGRVAMNDPGFSFSYDVSFDAPITKITQKIETLGAEASKADHALWRLKILEIEFTPENFRSRVLRGDADVVRLFVHAGMPVETENALTEAVERGDLAVAKVLIDAGANVNAADTYKQSLVLRASSGNRDMVKLLIDAGADVNIANSYKITPLASAAEQGQLEIVKMLLAAGAKVNARNTSGGTALSVAVLRGYKDIVQVLIEAGANVVRDKAELLELAKDHPEIRSMIEKAAKKK